MKENFTIILKIYEYKSFSCKITVYSIVSYNFRRDLLILNFFNVSKN